MFCSFSRLFPCCDYLQQLHPHPHLQTLVKPAGGADLAVLGHLTHNVNTTHQHNVFCVLCPHLAVPAAPPAGDGVPRRHAVHGPPEEGAAGVAASSWRVLWSYLRSQQSAEIACRFYCVFIHLVLTSEVEMLGRCGPAHGALHPQRWLLPPSFGLNMVRGLA